MHFFRRIDGLGDILISLTVEECELYAYKTRVDINILYNASQQAQTKTHHR